MGLRHYLLSVQFFSRIPVTGRLAEWVGYSPAMLRASAAHFPGVGVLLGALLTVFALALVRWLPATPVAPLVTSALVCVASLLLTGAFHEDGLADVADGLGGAYERDRALTIMKDSRVGAYGAIAVAMALLLRVVLVAQLLSIDVVWALAVLFVAQVSSRSWPLWTIRLLPHVGDAAGSKSKPLADQISGMSLAVAALWFGSAACGALALPAVVAPGGATTGRLWAQLAWAIVAGTIANAAIWWHLLRWFRKRLEGFTGDCLGATQIAGEMAFYLGSALSIGVMG